MPKYTAGPWRVGDAGNTVFGPPCGLPPKVIADLSRTGNRHANARLIAASPRLLEELENLTQQIDLSKLNIKKDFSLIAAHAAALSAIHEAKGE